MKDDDPNHTTLIERITRNSLQEGDEDEGKMNVPELNESRNHRREIRRSLEEMMDDGECEEEEEVLS